MNGVWKVYIQCLVVATGASVLSAAVFAGIQAYDELWTAPLRTIDAFVTRPGPDGRPQRLSRLWLDDIQKSCRVSAIVKEGSGAQIPDGLRYILALTDSDGANLDLRSHDVSFEPNTLPLVERRSFRLGRMSGRYIDGMLTLSWTDASHDYTAAMERTTLIVTSDPGLNAIERFELRKYLERPEKPETDPERRVLIYRFLCAPVVS